MRGRTGSRWSCGPGRGGKACVAWTRTCSGISPWPGVATTFQNAFSHPTLLCSSSCAVSRLTRPFPILHPRISIPLPTGAPNATMRHPPWSMLSAALASRFACTRVHSLLRVYRLGISTGCFTSRIEYCSLMSDWVWIRNRFWKWNGKVSQVARINLG